MSVLDYIMAGAIMFIAFCEFWVFVEFLIHLFKEKGDYE